MNEPATDLDALMSRQRQAWERHMPVHVETLLGQHPDLRTQKEALLDLINHEIVLRCEFGSPPTCAEYIERFPDLAADLTVIFEVQEAIDRVSDSTLAPETSAEKPGLMLGQRLDWPSLPNYMIIDVLGQGGMGVVYKAADQRLKRLVALKMIRGAHASETDRVRFQKEAEAVAKLDHPGIVHIHDIGDVDGEPYFALEYVDGGSLSGLLQGLPQPATSAARLVEILARSVHYAHSHGTIHRDLKPANILLQKVGDSQSQLSEASYWVHAGAAYLPKVADFGLAKHMQDESDLTKTRAIVGTPSYMAPEQAGESGGKIGPTADVYSLGAILYEMLTGRPPFRGQNVLDTLDQVRSQDPVAPTRLQPKVPRDLETICLKCLRKTPAERYVSAEALADDLGRFMRHEPIRARPTSVWRHVRLWCQRRPVVAALSGMLVVGTVVALLSMFFLWQRALKGEEDANAKLYQGQIDLAHRDWHENKLQKMHMRLESLRPPVFGRGAADRRDFEWYYLNGLLHQDLGRASAQNCLAYTPDGTLIAAGAKNEVHFWKPADLETGSAPTPIARLKAHSADVTAIAFNPKGDRFVSAAAEEKTARLWDVVSQETIKVLEEHPGKITSVAINAEGVIATACTDGLIRLWEPDGNLRLLLDMHVGQVNHIVFSADGRRLISGGADRKVIAWDVVTGDPAWQRIQGEFAGVHGVAIHGNRVASVGVDASLRLWDARDGKPLHQFQRLPMQASSVAFRGDGNRLAAACWDDTIRVWDTDPARKNYSDEPMFVIRGRFERLQGLAFSPAGDRLGAVGRDGLRVWDALHAPESRAHKVSTPRAGMALHPTRPMVAIVAIDKNIHLWNWRTNQRQILAGDGGSIHAIAFSGDGLLASAGEDGKIRLWDVDREKLLRVLPGNGKPIVALDYHPGGNQIATASDQSVIFWEASGGRKLFELQSHSKPVSAVAFSPDGRWVASAGADGISICDCETRRELHRLSNPGDLPKAPPLAISADGERLASAGAESTIRVWNARTGALLHVLEGQRSVAITFSRNGKRLASLAPSDIKIWDLATGQDLLTLRTGARNAHGIAFTQDDAQLMSLLEMTDFESGQIRVWDSTPGRK